jgi:hypothetical protein
MVSTVASHATDPGSIPGPSIESIFSIYFFFHNIQIFYFLQQVPMLGSAQFLSKVGPESFGLSGKSALLTIFVFPVNKNCTSSRESSVPPGLSTGISSTSLDVVHPVLKPCRICSQDRVRDHPGATRWGAAPPHSLFFLLHMTLLDST